MSDQRAKPAADPKVGHPQTPENTAKAKKTAPAAGPAPHDQELPPPDQVQPRRSSKQDQLAALLVRDEGTTVDHMTEVTGWLPHTVRAALTGLKKKGYVIDSDKVDGVRTYRAVAPR
jgi:hypothetical protein